LPVPKPAERKWRVRERSQKAENPITYPKVLPRIPVMAVVPPSQGDGVWEVGKTKQGGDRGGQGRVEGEGRAGDRFSA